MTDPTGKRTPANLFTGFLGVGKTTAILHLLRQKPASENWAVLVNEYGEVGIDGAMMEGASPEGVTVREVGGGCFCCTTAPYLPVALHFLFVDAKPDRLLIETSGLGHPAGILDTLRASYADRLDLRATIGIVAPADLASPGMTENPIFRDQVQMADVLVLNKVDRASDAGVIQFQTWANDLFPPKLLIAATEQGHLDVAWLDLTARHERFKLLPTTNDSQNTTVPLRPEPTSARPESGSPVKYETRADDAAMSACGWVFHPGDVFEEDRLLELFGSEPGLKRMKGVFHVRHEWIAMNRVDSTTTVTVSAYRRDSRVECIGEGVNWDEIEIQLLKAMITSGH